MRKMFFILFSLSAFIITHAQTAVDSLKEYTGTYKFPAGSEMTTVEITIQDGALFGASNLGSAALVRVNKDTFSIPAHDGTIYFSRNAEKKVVKIHIEVGEMILDGEKDNGSLAFYRRKFNDAK
jgi:uncharacterized protein DUF3471